MCVCYYMITGLMIIRYMIMLALGMGLLMAIVLDGEIVLFNRPVCEIPVNVRGGGRGPQPPIVAHTDLHLVIVEWKLPKGNLIYLDFVITVTSIGLFLDYQTILCSNQPTKVLERKYSFWGNCNM